MVMSSSPSRAPDIAAPPSLLTRALGGFGASILGGAALGAAAWFSDQLGYPLGLLIPANAIGVWLGVAFVLGAIGADGPDRRAARPDRPAVGGRRVLPAHRRRSARGSARSARRMPRRSGVRVALLAGPLMGGAGAIWRHGHGWPRAIGVAVLAAALVGGGRRLRRSAAGARGPARRTIRAPSCISPRSSSGWPCRSCSFGVASGCAATSRPAALAIVAALAIGPVTTLVRGIADRFGRGVIADADGWSSAHAAVESPGHPARTRSPPMKIFLDTADIERDPDRPPAGACSTASRRTRRSTPRSAARTTTSCARSARSRPGRSAPRSWRTTSTGCCRRVATSRRSPRTSWSRWR